MHRVVPIKPEDQASFASHRFRLYVACESVNSKLAFNHLKDFCETFYPDDYHIEQVDVLLSPEIAWEQGVTATPMLVRLTPVPNIKLMGNLSDAEQLSESLGPNNG